MWYHDIFNRSMNSARVSVEHVFGTVTRQWQFLDYARAQKIGHTKPGLMYLNGQFLSNCRNCMGRPNQTQTQFNLRAPSLRAYLRAWELDERVVRNN